MTITVPPAKRGFGPVALTVGAVYAVTIGLIVTAVLVAGGGGGGGVVASGPTVVDITLTEFSIDGNLTVPEGEVVLNVTNAGSVEHNLAIEELDKRTANLRGGASENLSLGTLAPGTYEIICEIAGHKDSGMTATLTVTPAGADVDAAAAAAASSSGDREMTPAEQLDNDHKMMAQMATFGTDAVATKGRGNEPAVPTIAADGAKEFTLTASVIDWEVEPGKIVKAWAYNGMVPGPWIKVDLGDMVRIKFVNELPMSSDIHWHGIHVPNSFDGVAPYTQTMVEPGEEFVYEFPADQPAVGMYHAHMHGEVAVPNGLFAAFQVGDLPLPRGRTVSGIDIPQDLNIVQELPMVLNDAGEIGYSLNGKSFPSTEPVVVNKDDWFLVHYYNEGLQVHPMHMHGFPQLVVAKDGIYLDQPYWGDTILVSPGERFSVLVKATDVGTWVWHCHILNHVEMSDRLFGMATAVVVKDPAAA